MPVGVFGAAAADRDTEIYRDGVAYLTSGRASHSQNDSTTRQWLRRMEAVHTRQAHREGGGKKGK